MEKLGEFKEGKREKLGLLVNSLFYINFNSLCCGVFSNLLHISLQTRDIRNCESIRRIVGFWDIFQAKDEAKSILYLRFWSSSASADTFFYLEGGIFPYVNSFLSETEEYRSATLSYVDTRGNISMKKKFLDSANRRPVLFYQQQKIMVNI